MWKGRNIKDDPQLNTCAFNNKKYTFYPSGTKIDKGVKVGNYYFAPSKQKPMPYQTFREVRRDPSRRIIKTEKLTKEIKG